jgi:hypothetical protein
VSLVYFSLALLYFHIYDFLHGIKANRLTPIISFWVNSFVSFLFCNLFYFFSFIFWIIFLSTVFYSLCPCLFETFRQAPSTSTEHLHHPLPLAFFIASSMAPSARFGKTNSKFCSRLYCSPIWENNFRNKLARLSHHCYLFFSTFFY